MGLEHEIKCGCAKCYNEFLPIGEQNLTELKAMKLKELAEQEGGLKAFMNAELEQLPNYDKACSCDKSVNYEQELGDYKYRNVCLRCGGRIDGDGTLQRCPKCNSGRISAGDWNSSNDEARCAATCKKCGCVWTEIFTNARWELVN